MGFRHDYSLSLLAGASVSKCHEGENVRTSEALADNADRNANARMGAKRFHGRTYRFQSHSRQAYSADRVNVLQAEKLFSLKVYEMATDSSQSVTMCPVDQKTPDPSAAKARTMPRNAKQTQTKDLLSQQYRSIGPAAVLAALIFCPRERKKSDAKAA